MIKFIIISRHKPGMTRERFFYEWAFIHVALMVQTASSMKRFKRYVQHYANPDIGDDQRLLPHPPKDWESYAEHWLERFEAYSPAPDYADLMRPHWRDVHVPRVIAALRDKGLRKYELNQRHDIDLDALRQSRKGSLFDKADVNSADGFEELWFDSLEQAMQVGADNALRQPLRASLAEFVDLEQSYSMFANERVVIDFVTPGEQTPRPAVLDPDSLEARLFTTHRPYYEPRLPD